jgi:tRNA(Ile2) C34 agmatinyltransferase TiaS
MRKIRGPARAETAGWRGSMSEQHEKWGDLQAKINAAIAEWRREHPEATLTEIEEAVDSRMAEVRTQMVEDLAHEGRTWELKRLAKEERPRCPRCGQPAAANGKGRRKLRTYHGQVIELERDQAYCQHCEVTFFPSR